MNTKEAIQALIEGHKVRNKTWSSYIYIYFDEDTLFDSNRNKFNTLSMSFSNDWEIYEEPKQTVTVEKWLCLDGGFYFTLEGSSDFINDYNSNITKVKLLDTYEVEL